MATYDVVVIGAGPAGEVGAGRLGEGGLRVAIVEEELIGGECSYWACMPSKALLRPAEALAEVRRIPGASQAVTGSLDVRAALSRRDEVIHDLDDAGQIPWLRDRNVDLVRGRARVTGERTVEVEGAGTLRAERAVIVATGSDTAMPPIPGLREAKPWTNREATTAKQAPDELVVLGGGVVGVELAQAWQALGSQVTLIEGANRLIPREETFACEQLTEALSGLGVRIMTGRKGTAVSRDSGQVAVTLDDGEIVTGDELLVAVGRRPNTACVADLGFEPGRPISVDRHMRSTEHPWLYAIGDVNGRAPFTHMGKYQARVAADHLLGRPSALDHGADGTGSPRVIFTDPQVAAVGHTLGSAREAGLNVRSFDAATSGNAGGSFYGRNAPGTARIVVDDDSETLAGATITGAEVAEFLHAATVALVGRVPLSRLRHAVPAFPTRSELWLDLLEQWAHAR